MRLKDQLSWQGTTNRRGYALAGFGGLALKFNLDRLVAALVFDRAWHPIDYLESGVPSVFALSGEDARLYFTMLVLALPFIWIGLTLTIRRLRSAGLPLGLVLLFFVPLINVLFFLMLCVLPARGAEAADDRARPVVRWVPDSRMGSAAVAVGLTTLLGLPLTVLSASVLGSYGWSLFVGLPFAMGLVAALIHGARTPRSLGACLGVAATAVGLLSLALFFFAVEGLFCLAMAAPIGLVLALAGGLLGYFLQRRTGWPAAAGVLVLAMPILMGAEAASAPSTPRLAVRTSVVIAAPPARVWNHVVSFSALPPPASPIFRLGIAYPTHATITGTGVGAVRRCEFSTGAFIEPITVWEAPRRLAFSVAEQPPPMRELGIVPGLKPPHLDHYMRSRAGQFELELTPDGGTRLTGTTWYELKLWPGPYWQVWSDAIVHAIHGRVLDHIKALAEQP